MEWDSSVKRLDFEDVSVTEIRQHRLNIDPAAATAPSEGGNDALSVSGAPSVGSLVELPDDCSIAELRQEAQRIRKDLTSVDNFVSDFSHSHHFQQKVKADAEAEENSVKQLEGTTEMSRNLESVVQKVFSMLEAESLELRVKQGILERLAEWKFGDEKNEDESWLNIESAADADGMGDELKALKNKNAETILEIESLIRTVANDVNGLETDLSSAFGALDTFDLEVDKLAKDEGSVVYSDNDTDGHLSVLCKQSENLHDLESTIRQLELTLRQNEKEYAEAEAAMESRIEQYNLEIEELQTQASQLDREEECMRMLIDVTARFLQSQKHMEHSNDVSVVSMENGSIELRLTTYVPNLDDPKDVPDQGSDPVWEHNLHIEINQDTKEIEEAKLSPESVRIDDFFSAAREKRVTNASLAKVEEGALEEFGPPLAFLVRAVHQRLTIHAFKVASVSSASSDPRYSVEHVSGSSLITIIKPGKLKALMEIPENWPMHGYSLRLQSLQLLEAQPGEAATTDDTMKMAVDIANKMPEYIRHDLFSFMHAAERITSEGDVHIHS